jgi:hypothetical protein
MEVYKMDGKWVVYDNSINKVLDIFPTKKRALEMLKFKVWEKDFEKGLREKLIEMGLKDQLRGE